MKIFYVGGDQRCWQSESGTSKMNAMWDDIATLPRARINQRIERCEAAGIQPTRMSLDGACLCRKLRRTPNDAYHFADKNESCKLDRDGAVVE
eukprot:2570480-Pyramimonas_sp.AAC.1